LIRIRESPHSPAAVDLESQIASIAGYPRAEWLERARRMAQEAVAKCLAELREDELGTKRAQAIARDLGAFAAIGQELARGGALLTGMRHEGVQSDAA
jgi:hypothetical protein